MHISLLVTLVPQYTVLSALSTSPPAHVPIHTRTHLPPLGTNAQDGARPGPSALILVPTKELCEQTYRHIKALTAYCSQAVSVVAVSSTVDVAAQKYVGFQACPLVRVFYSRSRFGRRCTCSTHMDSKPATRRTIGTGCTRSAQC